MKDTSLVRDVFIVLFSCFCCLLSYKVPKWHTTETDIDKDAVREGGARGSPSEAQLPALILPGAVSPKPDIQRRDTFPERHSSCSLAVFSEPGSYEMAQSYGAVTAGVAVTHTEHHGAEENERSALLGSETVQKSREGHAGLVSSVSNLSNTIIGSGASTLPFYSCCRSTDDDPNP